MGESDQAANEGRALAPTGPNRDRASRRILLAREAPIRLGALVIEPTLRRVAHGDGREEIVEPRVMQVLVALIQAGGQILSRDDLLMSCWHGVVVGEDAINRVMSRLRRLVDGIGGGEFKLETITKVGYRLVSSDSHAEIGPSASTASAERLASATTPEPLLAVLAFDNLCDGADMSWFSDGVSEEILQTVARRAELKVIGRGSSFQFRGADKAAAHVSAALKATHVLDGSVRRSGSRVRIAANLIECAGETTLWSDQFDRDLSEVFALQDEIAAAVAAAMKKVFASMPIAETVDPAAYDLFLKAQSVWGSIRLETRVEQTVLLEQATRLAPNFARAWLSLARVRAARLRLDDQDQPNAVRPDQPYRVRRAEALDAAETALGLDPGLGDAHQILSELEPFGRWAEREALHQKALSVAPNSQDVLANAGQFSASVGRIHEAVSYARRAYELDRLSPVHANIHATILGWEGRYEETRGLWARFRALWPEAGPIANNAFVAAARNEDWEKFEDIVRDVRARGLYSQYVHEVTVFHRDLGNPDPVYRSRYLAYARDKIARALDLPFIEFIALRDLGYGDEAFDMIDQASFAYVFDTELRWPNGSTPTGIIFGVLDNKSMMSDPRFPRLCARLGLCDYWVNSGRWPDCAEGGVLPYDFKAECRRLVVA